MFVQIRFYSSVLSCRTGGGQIVFLEIFHPKEILLWPTQIKEFLRKSYPPFLITTPSLYETSW